MGINIIWKRVQISVLLLTNTWLGEYIHKSPQEVFHIYYVMTVRYLFSHYFFLYIRSTHGLEVFSLSFSLFHRVSPSASRHLLKRPQFVYFQGYLKTNWFITIISRESFFSYLFHNNVRFCLLCLSLYALLNINHSQIYKLFNFQVIVLMRTYSTSIEKNRA